MLTKTIIRGNCGCKETFKTVDEAEKHAQTTDHTVEVKIVIQPIK